MSISKDNKKKLIDSFAKSKQDTGSTSVQIAILTERINNLTEHFKTHNKDKHSKRGLVAMVNKRKKLLSYLSKRYNEEYKEIISKLKLRG